MSRRPSEIPVLCHICCTPLRLADLKVHPGTKYGPHAPVFCGDEHLEAWTGTMEAHMMLAGASGRQIAEVTTRGIRRWMGWLNRG